MKKLFLILLLLISCMGCSSKQYPYSVGILTREEQDEGVLLFTDEDYNILFSKSISYPDTVYLDSQRILYSYDGYKYYSVNLNSYKEDLTLENVSGTLLAVDDNGHYFYYSSYLGYFDGSSNHSLSLKVSLYFYSGECLYCLDDNDQLYIFNVSDGSQIAKMNVSSNSYAGFTGIDDQVYLISDVGYMAIDSEKGNTVYLYPVTFDEIIATVGQYLTVYENNERAVYEVSFSQHQMKMELQLDDKFYNDIYYEDIFKKYYDAGYTVFYYSVLN